jgi:non-ribosomal peptide synthetase component E (peptide arylation enzyme)
MPRTINFVAELPKTLVGKIDKKAIVAKYLATEDK